MRANSSRDFTVLLIGLLVAFPAFAKFEKEQAALDALMAKRQYASAAEYIHSRPNLLNEPRFFRQLSHILTNYYTFQVNFGLFATRDLKEGERLEDVRGAKGDHKMVGGDWEKSLYDTLKKHPESPDINFAVGEYLSLGQLCGCTSLRLFRGEQADDFFYFERAYKGDVFDYWSLFRMGNHYAGGPSPDLKKATGYYEKSLKLNPDYTETHYNLASVYYSLGDYVSAKKHSAKTLGKYPDATLNADSYANYGRIEAALGNYTSAEKNYQKAREYVFWHAPTFNELANLYRKTRRFDAYKKTVNDYIALDYGNTYTFNVYVDYLADHKLIKEDREIVTELAKRQYSRTEEIGAVFFNLGRIAEMEENTALASQYYAKSLEAVKKLPNPPPGAIEALTQYINRLQSKGPNSGS
jgi:tetratricopeptide (TPR) repeat protein